MKLAFSTNAFKRTSLEDAIDVIARLGYHGVEIMADIPHAYPRDMPPARIAAVKDQIARRHLTISNINAFTLFAEGDTYHPTWIEEDPTLRRMRVEHTKKVIKMAAALGGGGGGTISLQPGGPLDALSREKALDRYEQGLREVLNLAGDLGIILTIEPEPGLLIQYSHECIQFLNRVDHPNLKMNCDLGHFYCVNEDPALVIRNCAGWIQHIHLEDIPENRVHQHHIPGTGAMDFDDIFTAIQDIYYRGWITVELYPYETTAEEAAKKAFDYLKKYF